jgi:hypothetical protein
MFSRGHHTAIFIVSMFMLLLLKDLLAKLIMTCTLKDKLTTWLCLVEGYCRMDLSGPTTSVGIRTDYSVGPWDYSACATRHLKAWSTRTAEE